MPLRACLLALVAVVAWGCASAKDAYVDGMELETAGDVAGAANAYIVALGRDRSLPNVAGRLRVAGRDAVRRALAEARGLDAEGAALRYQSADDLIRRAAAVGVDLDRPATFDADRDAHSQRAVRALADDAERLSREGAYGDALGRLARARGFRPTDAERARLDRIAVEANTSWAHADLAAGRYRDALARADAGLALAPTGASARDLESLRDDIFVAGQIVVAVFPAEGDHAPAAFLRDVADVLVDEHLDGADPFVALVPPAEVRAWTRRRRGPDLSDSPRRLGEAADALRADVGVVTVVTGLAEQETAHDAETETVRVRDASERATITVRDIDLELTARADVVVGTASGRTVCDETVEARGSARYARATTSGDWRRLDLSRAQRAAFAPDAADRARDRAFEALRDRLAAGLATRAQRCLARQVP